MMNPRQYQQQSVSPLPQVSSIILDYLYEKILLSSQEQSGLNGFCLNKQSILNEIINHCLVENKKKKSKTATSLSLAEFAKLSGNTLSKEEILCYKERILTTLHQQFIKNCLLEYGGGSRNVDDFASFNINMAMKLMEFDPILSQIEENRLPLSQPSLEKLQNLLVQTEENEPAEEREIEDGEVIEDDGEIEVIDVDVDEFPALEKDAVMTNAPDSKVATNRHTRRPVRRYWTRRRKSNEKNGQQCLPVSYDDDGNDEANTNRNSTSKPTSNKGLKRKLNISAKNGKGKESKEDRDWWKAFDAWVHYYEDHNTYNVPEDEVIMIDEETGELVELGRWVKAEQLKLDDYMVTNPERYNLLSELFLSSLLGETDDRSALPHESFTERNSSLISAFVF